MGTPTSPGTHTWDWVSWGGGAPALSIGKTQPSPGQREADPPMVPEANKCSSVAPPSWKEVRRREEEGPAPRVEFEPQDGGLQRLSFLFDGEEVAWAFGLAGEGLYMGTGHLSAQQSVSVKSWCP